MMFDDVETSEADDVVSLHETISQQEQRILQMSHRISQLMGEVEGLKHSIKIVCESVVRKVDY
jgi:predicted  nucleic acid-binding Zn-ribbon protein